MGLISSSRDKQIAEERFGGVLGMAGATDDWMRRASGELNASRRDVVTKLSAQCSGAGSRNYLRIEI